MRNYRICPFLCDYGNDCLVYLSAFTNFLRFVCGGSDYESLLT